MAYYTKMEVFGFMKEVLERGKKGEIRIMVDPEEAAKKLGADEDLVAMFWVQPNNVEGSGNLKMGMDGKVFVKIDFDLYSDDRYAIDCYQAGKEGTTVPNIVKKRNEATAKVRSETSPEELERIKNAINLNTSK